MVTITSEQREVIAADASLIAVDAFAGSGKTSTLVQYALARPDKRFLYVAFNKSMATEAKERFPANVKCSTSHSLAYASIGVKYKNKLGNVTANDVAREFNCATREAKAALDVLTSFFGSVDPEIGEKHVNGLEEGQAELVALANLIWVAMQDLKSPFKMVHDGYFKLWANGRPVLSYDYILLDEAQDANCSLLDIILLQRSHAKIVLVGDRHQGIYGFRKAVNAMEICNADQRVSLTQSFRFGAGIADLASEILGAYKGEGKAIKGRADIDVQWFVDRTRPYTLLSRTNAALFGELARLITVHENALPKIHYVGGFAGYFFDRALDAFYLWSGQINLIRDAAISRFSLFSDYKLYGEEADDPEVKALVKVVEMHRSRVPGIYNALKACEVVAQLAQITVSTAHKSKGLEWDQVYLTDDFVNLPAIPGEFEPEEINLLYVAITRASRAIRLPENIHVWRESLCNEAFEKASVDMMGAPSDMLTKPTGGDVLQNDLAAIDRLMQNLVKNVDISTLSKDVILAATTSWHRVRSNIDTVAMATL